MQRFALLVRFANAPLMQHDKENLKLDRDLSLAANAPRLYRALPCTLALAGA